ncbi:aminotransferase class I/II-fold pyridoxal phosphate-dependent enzyme [Pseudomonas proteolytica]|jgi:aspartate aminotransferase|uniref:Aminotransferase class I/II-fold pyridoxal phosphate-dependent enzyme n=2 Tax=Pseudomonas proteolytica TaxID=219574 RepID=A0AAW5A905_9PSED|nr:amino acid aminotransferase [Pseudomonas proteolytica]TDR49323.1 aromatic amino acid aminotransferase [Pseudomonas brenneri]KAA8700461.1 aspartate/tyrosine/aromatic aminotransferase [Pseudomonas proteolytica]MCF5057707.1 aminotransferase class I/II-fold pyridoxal phosphate-dependent enzyme [Pseudomonas proteolytica]MCF5100093.1 aminotransferase class I/II-fold pyridoxal phosphate-dependent enzyme [Pseudomonas proteolytica]TWR83123.1 aspartate/tyrosine/aromatic aminotransferase [Pseudomonas 
MHFADIGRVPGDPILGLMESYAKDANPQKFDLGVGVYKDAQGLTPILQAVKRAEQRLVEQQTTKTYIGGHGDPAFGRLVSELVLGAGSALLKAQRAGATQTPGGTGALRLSADFIAHSLPGRGVWLSNPTWPIHETIFAKAGLKVSHYPYVGSDNRLDVPAMLATLATVPEGDVVLLHACCHNPTGFDLSQDDWRQVLQIVRERHLLPLIDFAYQGFGDGLEQDAWAVRLFADELPEVLITSSCSKNFGLYSDRVGALIVCANDAEKLLDVRSQLAFIARNLWSTPPDHGAAVVATILGDAELKQLWSAEVEGMRSRIAQLRSGLVEALVPHGLAERFAHVGVQRGMFSYTGLSAEQVKQLREKHSVYMVSSGRANVAGIDETRLGLLAEAIADVCRN